MNASIQITAIFFQQRIASVYEIRTTPRGAEKPTATLLLYDFEPKSATAPVRNPGRGAAVTANRLSQVNRRGPRLMQACPPAGAGADLANTQVKGLYCARGPKQVTEAMRFAFLLPRNCGFRGNGLPSRTRMATRRLIAVNVPARGPHTLQKSKGARMMSKLEVFEPAMCCPTGVCGVDVDPVLAQFNADLQWLAEHGVEVVRHSLSHDAAGFAGNPAVVKELQAGMDRLPIAAVDGHIVSTGVYPSRAQLMQKLGVKLSSPGKPHIKLGASGCKPGEC